MRLISVGIHHGHDGAPGPSHNKPADKPTHHKKPDRKHGYTNYYSGEESYTGGSGSGDYGGSGSGSGDGSRPGFDDDDRGKYDFTNKNKKPVPPVRKPPPKSDKEDDYNNVNKPAGFGSSAHRALSPSVTVLLVLPALVCLLVRFLPTVRWWHRPARWHSLHHPDWPDCDVLCYNDCHSSRHNHAPARRERGVS